MKYSEERYQLNDHILCICKYVHALKISCGLNRLSFKLEYIKFVSKTLHFGNLYNHANRKISGRREIR